MDANPFAYLHSSMEGVDDIDLHQFVVRKVAALPLYVGSTPLPVPRLNGFSKVVPSSVCNVYNATLSSLPIRVVSIVVMSSVDDVTSLIIRMEKLSDIIGKDHVLQIRYATQHHDYVDPGKHCPCLVTDEVPEETIGQFLARGPTLTVRKSFFRTLWSSLSKLHEADKSFGNLVDGVRVLHNAPKFAFPADIRGVHHGQSSGMLNDLCTVVIVAIHAFSDEIVQLKSFLAISRDVFPARSYKAIKMTSYLMLHHSLVWTPDDGIRYCMRLHEYYMRAPADYHSLANDGVINDHPFSALGMDWRYILDHTPKNTKMLIDRHYREACLTNVYQHSESLWYYIRCRLSHLDGSTVEKMFSAIVDVFPEAMARLYYMAYRRFHFQDYLRFFQPLGENLPNYVGFFRYSPGRPNSFQF